MRLMFLIFGVISFIVSVFGAFSAHSIMHEIYSSVNFLIFIVCFGFAELLNKKMPNEKND